MNGTTDPIADMLTRLRNALMVRHEFVLVPASEMKQAIGAVLKQEGFIRDYEVLRGKPQKMIRVHLRYDENNVPFISGLKRVSKPGLRVYVGRKEIPRLYGGMGVAIMSTSSGVMTGQEAWRRNLGGELLCYAW